MVRSLSVVQKTTSSAQSKGKKQPIGKASAKPTVKRVTSRYVEQSTGLSYGAIRRLKSAQNSRTPAFKKTSINRFINEIATKLSTTEFSDEKAPKLKISRAARTMFLYYVNWKACESYTLGGDFMRQAGRRSLAASDMKQSNQVLSAPALRYM